MEQPITARATVPRAARLRPVGTPPATGKAALFEEIMRLYNQRLYRLAFGLVGDAGEAEDVLQESYVKAFLNLSRFAGRCGLGVWLASIVRNQAIDHLRTRRARRAAFTLESDLPRRDGDDRSALEGVASEAIDSSPEIDRQRADTRQVLETAIALLPSPFRAVFLLREVEGLSLQQTAILLGIPIATVKTRDHRARLMLQETLGDEMRGHARDTFEFLRERCDRIVSRVLRRLALL